MTKNLSLTTKTRVSLRNRSRNRAYKSVIKTLTKSYLNNVNNANFQENLSNLSCIYSKIDKAVKKGVLHKNCGARKKSFLARAMKSH
ncbi:30S ribosomal protein S20 (plastid) [Chondrus crispus]|uniref:30S ribosomal protein S20 n=1 Tax=Chondrus crispus TaxID=2769 RepID=M5DES9_CHOCR|nr:30S ribosomal protein S20 [Chondrus crispus]CCP38171.1 30S ribosomal protein S20 [Chondrus crispus]|eukprot:YP_007627424.1 30S ribosomal protein S20 (plastid) [Chondrus crispus]